MRAYSIRRVCPSVLYGAPSLICVYQIQLEKVCVTVCVSVREYECVSMSEGVTWFPLDQAGGVVVGHGPQHGRPPLILEGVTAQRQYLRVGGWSG